MNSPDIYRQPKQFERKIRGWFSSTGLLLYVLPFLAIPATIKAFITGNLAGIIINARRLCIVCVSCEFIASRLNSRSNLSRKTYYSRAKMALENLCCNPGCNNNFFHGLARRSKHFLGSSRFRFRCFIGHVFDLWF